MLLDKDTVAARETGLQGRGRTRTPSSGPLMRYRRNRGTQRGLDPPSFKRCPGARLQTDTRGTGCRLLPGTQRAPTLPHPGRRRSPAPGARRWVRDLLFPGTQRAPTLPAPGARRWVRDLLFPGNQRTPTLPHPGEATGADLLLPGTHRAPTTPRLGDPVRVRPPRPQDPHSARPLPPGDSLPLARSPASGPPCARRPRSSPPPEPTGPRCVLTVVAMVRPAPRLAHRCFLPTEARKQAAQQWRSRSPAAGSRGAWIPGCDPGGSFFSGVLFCSWFPPKQ